MNSILIIVPTKNSSKYLARLVKSLIDQTDPNWRVIFVDYKSEKYHKNYLKNICKKDDRFKIINQKINSGIYGAQNIGFELCKKNEWILFWGSDDYASNNSSISSIRKILLRNKKHDLIIFKGRFVDLLTGQEKSKNHFSKIRNINLNQKQYKKLLFFGFRQTHQGTLINPWLRLKKLRYNQKFNIAADLNYFLDCAKTKNLNLKLVNIHIVDIGFGGCSRQNNIIRFKEVIFIYWKHFSYRLFIPFFLRYIKC